jgi:hypothetical protein
MEVNRGKRRETGGARMERKGGVGGRSFRPRPSPSNQKNDFLTKRIGTFKLTLEFTEEYPNRPPLVKFVSQVYHPNVYADGGICLDILQKAWSPIYDVAAVLTSVQSLLSDPNPDSPANAEAARLYGENRREYNRRVKEVVERSWIEGDAGGGGGSGGGGEEGGEAGGRRGEGEGANAAAAAATMTATETTDNDASRSAGSAGAARAKRKRGDGDDSDSDGERACNDDDHDDNAAAATLPPPPGSS